MIQFRGLAPSSGVGDQVGNVKWTWYVRFHGRTQAVLVDLQAQRGPQGQTVQKVPQEAAESMMSYADL